MKNVERRIHPAPLLIALALLLALIPVGLHAFASEPVVAVNSWTDFSAAMANDSTAGAGKVYQLKKDLTLSGMIPVVSTFKGTFDGAGHFHRFIGTPNDSGANADVFGLYDFYGSGTSEEIRLIGEGLPTFDKAMELYGARRWYDAKNLFALVLRENPRDNVARYYVFSCEQKLPA